MPSKLYGILAAGRPTLFLGARHGAIARLLEEADAGLALDLDQPAAWLAIIEALINDPARLAQMSHNARLAYERHYTQSHALAAWGDVFNVAPAEPAPAVEPKRVAA